MPNKDEVLQVAASLRRENAKLQKQLFELYTLYNLSKAFFMPSELDELFEVSVQHLCRSLKVNDYCLLLIDSETGNLVLHASFGFEPERMVEGFFHREFVLFARALKGRKPLVYVDLKASRAPKIYHDHRHQRGSLLCMPLRGRAPEPLGILLLRSGRKEGFAREQTKMYSGIAESLGIAIERTRTLQHSIELSNKDPLTGLFNRRYFFDRLERELSRAERYGRDLSLALVDLDNFKDYNDRHGHLRGDEALVRISKLLDDNLRRSDVLARYGGEEFVILLPETKKQRAVEVADKLRRRVEEAKVHGSTEGAPALTMTVGVAGLGEDAATPFELIEFADKALYYGKALGKNRVCSAPPKFPPE